MRKLIFYTILLLWALLLCACKLNAEAGPQTTIQITLPHWPPDDSYTEYYPTLSRWHIQVTDAVNQYSFYTTQNKLSVQPKKNRPLCVTARPITQLYDGSESDFFKPAGYIYPFTENQNTSSQITLNWELGYLATIMEKLFNKGIEEGFPPVEIEYLISTFNWKKAQETINKKILESNTDTALFYNPWLLQMSQLIEAIAAHSFKPSLLNTTNCTAITTAQLENRIIPADTPLLSSFIPENLHLPQKNQFTVMKNSPIIISDGNKYALFITYKSAKNISLELIYLPIYIGDI